MAQRGPPIIQDDMQIRSDSEVVLCVTVVRALDPPEIPGYTKTNKRKYYVTLKIGDDERKTQVSRKTKKPEWKDEFTFHAGQHAMLGFDVYAQTTRRGGVKVGGFSEKLESLLVSTSADTSQSIIREIECDSGKKFKLELLIKVDPQRSLTRGTADAALEQTNLVIAEMSAPRIAESSTKLMGAGNAVVEQVYTIETTLKPALEKWGVFCRIMDKFAEVHPYAKMAWTMLNGVYTVVQNQFDRDQKILALFAQMKSLYEIVDDLQRQLDDKDSPGIKSPKELLTRISIQTIDCCYLVRSYGSLPFAKRMTKGIFSNVDKRIIEYCAAFGSLKQEFYDRLHVDTHLVVVDTKLVLGRVLQVVEGIGDKAILSDMRYKDGASLGDKNKQCLPGTRTEFLGKMSTWANASESEDGRKSVCVLVGPAGTGKSAIAHSMCAHYRALHRLAASFGFKRGQGSDGLTMLFPTIAQDMADFDEDIRNALCAAVGGNKALRTTHDLERQFDHFILEPLKKIIFSGPVLIVIDALDECGDFSDQEKLASLLAERAKDFPPNLRILITSRAESHIIQKFQGKSDVVIRSMDDVVSTSEDIHLYVHFRLLDDCDLEDIDEPCCERLAEASQGLFQWASVACTQIATGTAGLAPLDIYQRLVDSASEKSGAELLDALYLEILSRLFKTDDIKAMPRFRSVLAMVLATFEPFTMDSLAAIRAAPNTQPDRDVALVLKYLGSLLSGVTTSHDPIRPLHTSFRDFLMDQRRSGDFFVDTSETHGRLSLASLHVMNKELVFNICQLNSSWDWNYDVADLADRIKKHIPHHLSYSCRFWGQHLLTASSLDSQFVHPFNTFISENLLSWLEVMSLTKSDVTSTFDELARLKSNHYFKTLEGISMDDVRDISNFLDMSQPAILGSAPHIYLSALPFARPNSFVANKYLPKFPHTLRICNPSPAYWPVWRILLPDRDAKVSDLVFTPFGTCVVATRSGPYILDATSGSVIHEPPDGIDVFRGCSAVAVCTSEAAVQVAFAPESGSQIYIWSPHTGHTLTISIPLPDSHLSQSVLSLSFPDNTKLFAGSSNGDIYRVDLPTGEVTVLYCSNELFSYVSFSSDGTLVAHAQRSGQAEVFNTTTQRHTMSQLLGCGRCRDNYGTRYQHRPTISPKGTYIVASCRCQIILWDLTTGECTNAACTDGQADKVEFSPDGRYFAFRGSTRIFISVVTASGLRRKCTIRWADPYGRSVVAYSADGQHIFAYEWNEVHRWHLDTVVSGGHVDRVISTYISDNGRHISTRDWGVRATRHLWDGATGKAIDPPPCMDGDTDLESIELASSMSPDGTFVVSICKFGTIRLWESSTDAWRTVWRFDKGGKNHAAIEFSPDGRRFACGFGNELRVQDVETGEGTMTSVEREILRVHFSPDGKNIAVRESGSYRRVINSDTLEDVLRVTSSDIAFSPDSTHLASREGWDIVVRQMNGTIVQRFTPPRDICTLEFLPSTTGVYLATAWEDITVWDMTSTPTPVLRLPCFATYVTSMACSRDGKRLVAGYEDGSVRVWDVSINSNNPAEHSPTPICFSTTPDHALPSSRFLMEHDRIDEDEADHYKTILEQRDTVNVNWKFGETDGWVTSPSRHRLLFWVPRDFRERLLMPGQQLILGVEPLELDLSQFVHGPDWAKCYQA